MTGSIETRVVPASRRARGDGSFIPLLVGSAIAAISFAGCSQADHSATGPSLDQKGVPKFAISVTLPSGRPKDQDEIFAEIAVHIPGYAGTYYDRDGTPITNLVDLAYSGAAEQAIGPMIQSGANGQGSPRSRFRKVAYDFLQLKKWKDYATSTISTQANVVSVDIDEENNRLNIGVGSANDIAPVSRILHDRHIPGVVGAMIPIDTSPSPQISPGTPETLRNTQSLVGGVMIEGGGFWNCTLGFNAKLVAGDQHGYYRTYSGDHFFVTVSHCMHTVGTVTGTIMYQTNTTREIGREYRQPLWGGRETYDSCPGGAKCSMADVALVKYSVPWGGSKIARTTFSNAGSDTGSVAIDPYAQPWLVVDSVGDATLLQNRILHKVGWHSGWTTGAVTQTCVNYRLTVDGQSIPYWILCSWGTSFTSLPGDSGSPVFIQKGLFADQVQLVGTVWAGTYGISTISFYPYMSWELTYRDTQYACGSVSPCWPRLGVSGL